MSGTDKQCQPHIGNRSLSMDEGLQTECEYDRCPPSKAFSAHPQSTKRNRHREQRGRNGRGETRGKIVLAENMIARDLCPIREGRLVEAKLIIEVRNNVITALDHLARGLRESRFVAVNQRQGPRPENVKKYAAKKQDRVFCRFRFQCDRSIS